AHGLLFIAMELQPGGTLKEAVQANGPLEIDRACRLCADAADALHYAHQHGVLHRDIKPGNLMLSRTGTCKVVDFGLAQIDDPSNPDPSNRTAGTPHYVAPEVVCNNPASPRADLYSLGSTLYFLLAGRKPFEHLTDPANRNGVDERTAVLRAQMDVPITPVTQYRPDVPAGLANLLEQALSKDPSQRPKDLGVFAKALRSFAAMPATASGSVELPPPPPPPPAMTQPRRARKKSSPVPMIVGVAGGIVVVGGLIAGGLMLGGNDETPTVAANSQPSADPAPALHNEPQPETPPAEEPEQPDPRPNPRPILPDVLIPETPTDDPPAGSDDAFAPGDKAELLAADGQRVTVVGDVSFARLSGSGKVFTVGFRGVEIRDGFTLVWFPRDFDAMANAFGGTHGEGIFNQRIRVTGTVSTYRNNPQIVIDNPDQIEVIE
ncbi:MAG: protein kinase, partial [Planctomycetota bacterium]